MTDLAPLVPLASVVGGFATGVAVGVAIVALVPAVLQIRAGRVVARHSAALEAHREYLRVCFENPEYSSAELALIAIGVTEWTGITARMTKESEKYLWFLSILLNAAEQIIEANSTVRPWRAVMSSQVGFHKSALKEIWPEWRSHYGIGFQRFVDGAIE